MSPKNALAEVPPTILVVDDEPYIRKLIVRWLQSCNFRTLEADGAERGWQLLRAHDIHLVTLDIAMPGQPGVELLIDIKEQFPELPVVMLTASGHTKTAIKAMTHGACGYLIKPIDQNELMVQVTRGLEWRQLLLDRRAYTVALEEKVREQTQIIREAHEETIQRLVTATMCRHEETGTHIIRTGLFSEILARAAGWSTPESDLLRSAAPMHDIGKIGIPDSILQKPGRLTASERDVMKTHTTIGYSILDGSKTPALQLAQQIALNHHERWDGNGYPRGIASETIPEAARILSIVDVYDALTHDRVYRPAMSSEEALSLMLAEQGRQFDPMLLTAFVSVTEEIERVAALYPDQVARKAQPLAHPGQNVLTTTPHTSPVIP